MSKKFPFEHFLNNKKKFQPSNITKQHDSTKLENKLISTFTKEELNTIETEILLDLQNSIAPEKFKAYFENIFKLETIEINVITFSVKTILIKSMIQKYFLDHIQATICNLLSKKYDINICVTNHPETSSFNTRDQQDSLAASKTSVTSAKNAKFTLTPDKEDLRLNAESTYINYMKSPPIHNNKIDPKKTFDNFVIGPSNNMAFATARGIAKNPGKSGKFPSLYLHSNSGLGKTHLLHAVANEINNIYPEMNLCLITARDFMKEMISFIQEKKLGEFQKKYSKKTDVLIIDDIHELGGKEGTLNEFFHIFNELHGEGKQLIFTSDKSPEEIAGIAPRIKTRLQWGLVIDIQKPDLETRIAILKSKACTLDMFLHDDIINLLASSIKSSIRELEGSLVRLKAFSDFMKVEIDIEIVREILKLDTGTKKEITIESIARATAQHSKIPLADLKSKARNKEIARARHIGMYLSHKTLRTTLKEIGHFYGGRDHTSALHGIEKIKIGLKTDSQLSKDIVAIEGLT